MASHTDNRYFRLHRLAHKIVQSAVCRRFFSLLCRVSDAFIFGKHTVGNRISDIPVTQRLIRRIYAVHNEINGRLHFGQHRRGILQGIGAYGDGNGAFRNMQAVDNSCVSASDTGNYRHRPIVYLIFFILFCLAFSVSVCGLDISIPENAQNVLDKAESEGIVQQIINALRSSVPDVSKTVATIICMLLICALAGAFKSSLSDVSSDACDMITSIACAGAVFTVIKDVAAASSSALLSSCTLMTSLLGVMCAIYGYTGNLVSGAGSAAVVSAVIQVIQGICSYVLLPAVLSLFGMTIASSIKGDSFLGAFISFVKQSVSFILTLCAGIVTFVLSVQTMTGSVAQNVTRKGIKLAISSFIPIVGSALSESFDYVTSSFNTVKTSTGIAGIVGIALIVIPPITYAFFSRLIFSFAAAVAETLQLPSQARLLKGCVDILSVILALLCFSCATLLIACALFTRVNTTL